LSYRRRPPEPDDYLSLENYLQRMMPQVPPRADFVVGLRQRLLNMPVNQNWLPTAFFFIVLILAGVVSGLILIATSLRALVTVFATLGLIYRYRSSSKGGSAQSA
jgi:hypothetical protein